MNEVEATQHLTTAGYVVDKIELSPGGSNHYSFEIQFQEGQQSVARFEKKIRIEKDGKRRDPQYNGILSLEREAYLLTVVRQKAHLPAPVVQKLYRTPEASFLLVEKMPGKYWNTFIKEREYSLSYYLSSLAMLGADLAKAQQVTFPSYGNIMEEGMIEPSSTFNFEERLWEITSSRIQLAKEKQALNEREIWEVERYFHSTLDKIVISQPQRPASPVLILTDLHPTNFFVDECGKPSGYFDLEFCQAGHPAMEFFSISLQFCSYFNKEIFPQAKRAFFEGYRAEGGNYEVESSYTVTIEELLSTGHMLNAVIGYLEVRDGLRDKWSEEFKNILFRNITAKEVDYQGFVDILRAKTKQPRKPALP